MHCVITQTDNGWITVIHEPGGVGAKFNTPHRPQINSIFSSSETSHTVVLSYGGSIVTFHPHTLELHEQPRRDREQRLELRVWLPEDAIRRFAAIPDGAGEIAPIRDAARQIVAELDHQAPA